MTPPPHKKPGHPQHEWLVNVEEERSLADIAQTLSAVASHLAADGQVILNGTIVAPNDPCEFMVRYERLPRGEFKLKLELTWEPDTVEPSDGIETGLKIG